MLLIFINFSWDQAEMHGLHWAVGDSGQLILSHVLSLKPMKSGVHTANSSLNWLLPIRPLTSHDLYPTALVWLIAALQTYLIRTVNDPFASY